MYEYTDAQIDKLKRKVQNLFNNMRLSLLSTDELNTLSVGKKVDKLFDRLELNADDLFHGLQEYKGVDKKKYPLPLFLERYSPVLFFVYANEVERKRARYKEAVLSANDLNDSAFLRVMNANINNWTKQVEESLVDYEREIDLGKMKSNGISKVMWVTRHDKAVCSYCEELDGQIFDIDKVPERNHGGCRCELIPVGSKGEL